MAIDTALKRASAMLVSLPFRRILPLPDGTITTGDRKVLAFLYALVAAAPPPPVASEGPWRSVQNDLWPEQDRRRVRERRRRRAERILEQVGMVLDDA